MLTSFCSPFQGLVRWASTLRRRIVFFMEPSFNPALEAQAIVRVHRLSQKRNVEVVRFIMKDSVEPRIQKMLKNKYADSSTDNEDDNGQEEK